MLGVRSNGSCVFFEEDQGRLCAVHRELGAEWLPAACRQFPRVVLHDARGTLISLSHFCPTAAALLLSPSGMQIVDAPTTLALHGGLEGFDARGALPPLLNPGMLTDPGGYGAWERRAIGVLARDDLTAAQAIETIAAATRAVQVWRPGPKTLRDVVEREFDVAPVGNTRDELDADEARVRLAVASVPHDLPCLPPFERYRQTWQDVSEWWYQADRAVRAYLAARLFGNWVAYYGPGLHAIVEYLRISLSVLKMEAARYSSRSSGAANTWQTTLEPAIRNADLLLVHLSDTKQLARRLA
jgi:hypothetical protein